MTGDYRGSLRLYGDGKVVVRYIGERQRLDCIIGLFRKNKLVLLDSPPANWDAVLVGCFGAWVRKAKKHFAQINDGGFLSC